VDPGGRRGFSTDEETDNIPSIINTTLSKGNFLSDAPDGEAEEEYFRMPEVPPEIYDTEVWTLFTDGAASLKGFGAAEYEALLAGLRIARKMRVDSKLVANQINGTYEATKESMKTIIDNKWKWPTDWIVPQLRELKNDSVVWRDNYGNEMVQY
ncbi:reverse transcriptase domain-containing protein, partial [Tanacetum coccineum]